VIAIAPTAVTASPGLTLVHLDVQDCDGGSIALRPPKQPSGFAGGAAMALLEELLRLQSNDRRVTDVLEQWSRYSTPPETTRRGIVADASSRMPSSTYSQGEEGFWRPSTPDKRRSLVFLTVLTVIAGTIGVVIAAADHQLLAGYSILVPDPVVADLTDLHGGPPPSEPPSATPTSMH
jgi:hypothetical protein